MKKYNPLNIIAFSFLVVIGCFIGKRVRTDLTDDYLEQLRFELFAKDGEIDFDIWK
jgi:hypothetical protein